MTDDMFDGFLQDSVLSIHDAWTKANGRELGVRELQQLNSLLDEFFQTKR
jgi:hypothetical protein